MPLIIFLCLLACIAIALILGVRYTYKRAFKRAIRTDADYYRGIDNKDRVPDPVGCRALIDRMLALETERVEIRSFDGVKLVGYYLHVRDDAPLEIMMHGFRSSWQRDFCGISRFAVELGHNILFVDQRAHGESEGNVISYGVNESMDAVAWVRYAVSRFGCGVKIALVGVSMGGASVLNAAGREDLPCVYAIVADSPFSSAKGVIKEVGKRGRMPAALVSALAHITARLYGFSLSYGEICESVAKSDIPMLIVHGKKDALVPYEMAKALEAASPKVKLESFEGADHVGSYFHDTERYFGFYKEFMERCGLL